MTIPTAMPVTASGAIGPVSVGVTGTVGEGGEVRGDGRGEGGKEREGRRGREERGKVEEMILI